MRYASLPLLLLLALVVGAADVRAQAAPQVGSCTLGTATATLDVNNVFAAAFNTGSLFFGGSFTNGDGYLVPKATGLSPIFASGIWIGGKVGAETRLAGSRYSGFEFWPGPLDAATGRPVNPSTCKAYDKIYSVTRKDIAAYENGGQFSDDLTNWPFDLGAPVIDGDGNPDNYNLAGGDRPDIIGDQSLWWVMNDVGATHSSSRAAPLGVEVQVQAFAFARADALGSTTFYKYKILNKGGATITNTYVSIFSDPDLGDATDDYVGSDPELGFGYVYNADNNDANYGVAPPAIGYDFFQGPIVPDGPDEGTDPDTLGLTAFSYFINGTPATTTGDPALATNIYNYQQGLWADGTEMRAYGDGYAQTQGAVTKFAFSGDPVMTQPWSEVNNGTATPLNPNGDRRLVVHTGPFTLNPGDKQDIVFGVVYARGNSNLGSITALRSADRLAQRAYDINFDLAPPPPPPPACDASNPAILPGSGNCLEATVQNGQITITYGYPSTSPNFLGRFEVINKFIQGQGIADTTYNFEGFNIYKYPTSSFAADQRELVATYDIVNGVTEVRDLVFDPAIGDNNTAILARGTDSGISYTYNVKGLTNYTDYYYGVTAYAYNEFSSPKINESSPTFVTARPSDLTSGVKTQGVRDSLVTVTAVTQGGEGVISARIVDPTQITGSTYQVKFFSNSDGTTNYSIVNTTSGATILDGADFFTRTGESLPQQEDVVVAEGLSFSVTGPPPGVKAFLAVANGAGPLAPPENASGGFQGFPYIEDLTSDRPTDRQQVGPALWLIGAGGMGTDGSYDNFLVRSLRNSNVENIGSHDYEWRFTGTSVVNRAFTDGGNATVPFTLWDIGLTPNDPSDDVQLIGRMFDDGTPDDFDLGPTDSPISGATNDPQTDWIYWYRPVIQTPGSAGYTAWLNGGDIDDDQIDAELFARMVLVSFNGGAVPGPYAQTVPEPGTVFRIVTLKPNLVGDTFEITTADQALTAATPEGQVAALDRIAAVPNPYLGQSAYETGNLSRIVRFTNLPEQAVTVRIYTISGSLVQTLRKDGPSRSLDWNLESSNNLPVASGMYLVHVDVAGVGERTLKLGVVERRTRITIF